MRPRPGEVAEITFDLVQRGSMGGDRLVDLDAIAQIAQDLLEALNAKFADQKFHHQ